MEVNNESMIENENEISIDFYVNYKTKIQEYLNKLDQSKLIELFHTIQAEAPNVQYSKNKNGYFIDIKQLSVSLIEKLDSKCCEFIPDEPVLIT
jgi:hypothetical protein